MAPNFNLIFCHEGSVKMLTTLLNSAQWVKNSGIITNNTNLKTFNYVSGIEFSYFLS